MARIRHTTIQVIKYATLIFAVLVVVGPLYFIFVGSFKGDAEFYSSSPFALPQHWNWQNFVVAWQLGGLGRAFLNTLFIICVAVIGNVLFGTMVAYVLGRFRFRLRKIILGAYIAATFVPMITTQVATFGVIKGLGVFDTPWAAIILYLGTDVVQIYIYLQFIRNIPYSLDESALLDGASYWRIFWSIIFPLLRPATATVIILKTMAIYNDMFIPWLYMPSENLGVVSTSLMRFAGPQSAHWNLICAAILIIIVPAIVLFLLLQKWVFAGIVSGAIKD